MCYFSPPEYREKSHWKNKRCQGEAVREPTDVWQISHLSDLIHIIYLSDFYKCLYSILGKYYSILGHFLLTNTARQHVKARNSLFVLRTTSVWSTRTASEFNDDGDHNDRSEFRKRIWSWRDGGLHL